MIHQIERAPCPNTRRESVVQRFLAVLLIVAGLGGIGFGIATAPVLRESDTVVATATPSGDGTMVVTEPGVLGLVDDQVTVRATVPEGQKVTLALGTDVDVLGWVGEDPYDAVTGLSSWETLRVVPGTPATQDTGDGEEGDGSDEQADAPAKPASGPDPAGSDMWISEVSGETTVSMRWTEEPGRVVLLAAGVGKNAEAPTLELTWPRPSSTPYLWPGVLGGGLLLILGSFMASGARRIAEAPTLELTWRRPSSTPYLWPGVRGSGFLLILGIFMAIGARRSAGRKNTGKNTRKKDRSSSVRTRRPESELPRREVFGVDGDRHDDADSPASREPQPVAGAAAQQATPAGAFPPPAGDAGGTAVFPPAGRRPGRRAPEPVAEP